MRNAMRCGTLGFLVAVYFCPLAFQSLQAEPLPSFYLSKDADKLPRVGPKALCRQPDIVENILKAFDTPKELRSNNLEALDFENASTVEVNLSMKAFSCHGNLRLSNTQTISGTFLVSDDHVGKSHWAWRNDTSESAIARVNGLTKIDKITALSWEDITSLSTYSAKLRHNWKKYASNHNNQISYIDLASLDRRKNIVTALDVQDWIPAVEVIDTGEKLGSMLSLIAFDCGEIARSMILASVTFHGNMATGSQQAGGQDKPEMPRNGWHVMNDKDRDGNLNAMWIERHFACRANP